MYVIFFLRMAIDCSIANQLIAIRSDRLTGYSYQNTKIFDMLLSFLIAAINNTENTMGILCKYVIQDIILNII